MKQIIPLLIILTSFFSLRLEAKIRFLTFHYNKPDFLELQIKTFQKFIEDDYELIVFNDAPSLEMAKAIKGVCQKYGINCIRYQQDWHQRSPLNKIITNYCVDPNITKLIRFGKTINAVSRHPSIRHSHVIQFALDHSGYNHSDLVVIIDGDMFPIRPVNVRALQEEYLVIGSARKDRHNPFDMLWVTFISLNMPLLPDKSHLQFHPDLIGNVLSDTGGAFHNYLLKHSDLKTKKFPLKTPTNDEIEDPERLVQQGFTSLEIELCKSLPKDAMVQFQLENQFLHYSGSSYTNNDLKIKCVKQFLKARLSQTN